MVFNQKGNHLTGVAIKSADTNSFAGNVLILGIEQQVWIFINIPKRPDDTNWARITLRKHELNQCFSDSWGVAPVYFQKGCMCLTEEIFIITSWWRRLCGLVHHCLTYTRICWVDFTVMGASCIHLYLSCSMGLPQVSDEWVVSIGLAFKVHSDLSLTCYRKPEHIYWPSEYFPSGPLVSGHFVSCPEFQNLK